jgi:hypothetical protein
MRTLFRSGMLMLGMSKAVRLSPGLLQSSRTICIITLQNTALTASTQTSWGGHVVL